MEKLVGKVKAALQQEAALQKQQQGGKQQQQQQQGGAAGVSAMEVDGEEKETEEEGAKKEEGKEGVKAEVEGAAAAAPATTAAPASGGDESWAHLLLPPGAPALSLAASEALAEAVGRGASDLESLPGVVMASAATLKEKGLPGW